MLTTWPYSQIKFYSCVFYDNFDVLTHLACPIFFGISAKRVLNSCKIFHQLLNNSLKYCCTNGNCYNCLRCKDLIKHKYKMTAQHNCYTFCDLYKLIFKCKLNSNLFGEQKSIRIYLYRKLLSTTFTGLICTDFVALYFFYKAIVAMLQHPII